jgi:hypothetical protein
MRVQEDGAGGASLIVGSRPLGRHRLQHKTQLVGANILQVAALVIPLINASLSTLFSDFFTLRVQKRLLYALNSLALSSLHALKMLPFFTEKTQYTSLPRRQERSIHRKRKVQERKLDIAAQWLFTFVAAKRDVFFYFNLESQPYNAPR